jgi:hypothetical protein
MSVLDALTFIVETNSSNSHWVDNLQDIPGKFRKKWCTTDTPEYLREIILNWDETDELKYGDKDVDL